MGYVNEVQGEGIVMNLMDEHKRCGWSWAEWIVIGSEENGEWALENGDRWVLCIGVVGGGG